MELLKQPQFHPFSMEKQVVSIWAGTHGKLDDLDLEDVLPFESQMHVYLEEHTDILDIIRETSDFTKDTEAKLNDAINAFRKTFITHDGKRLEEPEEPEDDGVPQTVDQEKLVISPKAQKG
jgi:F-type H+-transporting ATPase subunit alpha